LEEVKKVLKRDFEQSEELINRQIKLVESYAEIVEVQRKIDVVREDSDDNLIVECAVSADADFILSGDKHLLNLKEYNNIRIVSAREFLDILDMRVV